MLYALGANAVLLLHLVFILFAVAGGLLVLRWPRLMWVHLPAVAWAAAIEWFGWVCPLTPLENYLRGPGGYEGGFIEHYLLPFIYPPGLTRDIQILLAVAVVAINLIVYYVLAVRWHRQAQRLKRD
ncbi:MAG: DUF2784 domain-containing protein [Thiogranum sp.]|nr:DUF2784 domain-containing protein [Thiogranum sp.]